MRKKMDAFYKAAAVICGVAVLAIGCKSGGGEAKQDDEATSLTRSEERGVPDRIEPDTVPGQGSIPGEQEVVGHALRPKKRAPSDELVRSLKVAEGFTISIFGRDLGHARMMAAHERGPIYLTRPSSADVIALWDKDGDGRMDRREVVASKLESVHGVALRGDELFLASNTHLWRASIRADGRLGPTEVVFDDLAYGGQHPNRTIGLGPDNRLYISIGSSCNACNETDEKHAAILRASEDLSDYAIFARGLRNTIGFGWHPASKQMWGMDHGSDWRGDDIPPEELNHLQEGKDYGWPYAYGRQVPDRVTGSPPGGVSLEEYAERTEPAVLTYKAHSAPIGMAFYDHDAFGAEARGDAFVAMRGSWNRRPPTGYKIVRIRFDEAGQPQGFEDFVSGFLIEDGAAHFGRLAGVVVASDGALLFSDDASGVIYRVARRDR